jgi:HEAT repeat protein
LNPAKAGQRALKNKEDFIKPLLSILTSEEDATITRAAAEATLLFSYDQVQAELERAVTDPALSLAVRMNVIYALKRHPDRAAVAKLFSLLDSPEATLVDAARAALASIGIPVGQEPQKTWAELQQRGAETFLRDRLFWQETRVRELETDLSSWQKRYLTALNGQHDSLPDATKNAFLIEQLKSPEVIVRAWALDKVLELRNAKGTLNWSELEPSLSDRIADTSRQVRLKTALLLAKMGELNTSKPLLDQLKVETDESIKRQLLMALGEACYAGSMVTATRKVPEEVRKETLEWAVRFLNEADAEKMRSGAAVLGKLLEQDGLKPEEVDQYLKTLLARYTQLGAAGDPALRGYLLGVMAGLCAPRSTCREPAAKLYSGSFDQGLADKSDIVRQNAMDGCVNVDKPGALRKLQGLTADSNPAIRQKLIDLAGEVGGPQDLDWLVEKVGVAGEGDAWGAMLKVLRSPRCNLEVLTKWTAKVDFLAAAERLAIEQRIVFYTLVEQRALSENRADLLADTRTKLAQLYVSSSNQKMASEYLKALLDAAGTPEQRQQVLSQLLGVYLALANVEQASELIHNCLSAKDLDLANNFVTQCIENMLNDPKITDPGALIVLLGQIKLKNPEAAGKWQLLLSRWTERFAKAKKTEDSGQANN